MLHGPHTFARGGCPTRGCWLVHHPCLWAFPAMPSWPRPRLPFSRPFASRQSYPPSSNWPYRCPLSSSRRTDHLRMKSSGRQAPSSVIWFFVPQTQQLDYRTTTRQPTDVRPSSHTQFFLNGCIRVLTPARMQTSPITSRRIVGKWLYRVAL